MAHEHGLRLRRFLAARLREAASDVPDLVQEIYLRLLRVPRHDAIRSPQAYLFTVAHHVLYQHKLSLAATPEAVDVLSALEQMPAPSSEQPDAQVERHQDLQTLDTVLKECSPKVRAAFLLHRRFGYSVEEVSVALETSRPMAKKYIEKALAHCRKRLGPLGPGRTP